MEKIYNSWTSSIQIIAELLKPTKPCSAFAWIRIIFYNLLPFSCFGVPFVMQHIRAAPVCRKTPLRYLKQLTERVNPRILEILPWEIALQFDWWMVLRQIIFPLYFRNISVYKLQGVQSVILSFSPMENKQHINSQQNFRFSIVVLNVAFRNSWNNVVCFE